MNTISIITISVLSIVTIIMITIAGIYRAKCKAAYKEVECFIDYMDGQNKRIDRLSKKVKFLRLQLENPDKGGKKK